MIVLVVTTLTVLVGLVAALVLLRGKLSIYLAPPATTMGGGLPPGPVGAADVGGVRFDTVLRGYRMDQVDDVLARLADAIAQRDDEIAMLRDSGSVALRSVPVEGTPRPGATGTPGVSGPGGPHDVPPAAR